MSRYRHFGLTREPFALAPDLAFQAPALGQTDALARLRDAVMARSPLALVTGEPGLGKTMVRIALERDLRAVPALRLSALDDAGASWATDVTFLRSLSAALEHAPVGRTTLELSSEIQQRLAAIAADDHWPVLMIDDAHRLTSSQLELLRTVLGPEQRPAPISILLFSEPELEERIGRRRSLAGRLAMRHTLNPLNPRDAEGLLLHRLRVAGWPEGERIAGDAAMAALIDQARGNPRALIELAAAALDRAAAQGSASISLDAAAAPAERGAAEQGQSAIGGKR